MDGDDAVEMYDAIVVNEVMWCGDVDVTLM